MNIVTNLFATTVQALPCVVHMFI